MHIVLFQSMLSTEQALHRDVAHSVVTRIIQHLRKLASRTVKQNLAKPNQKTKDYRNSCNLVIVFYTLNCAS